MPGFDGTGPRGNGPMTGGARGYCSPDRAGYSRGGGSGLRRGYSPGLGWVRGYGKGFGRRAYPAGSPYFMAPKDEAEMLKDEAKAIESELHAIHDRIKELESEGSGS